MNIMVFDVPADSGGALSILYEFYNSCKNDKKNNYIFVIGKPIIDETANIKVLRYPWIKKSWLHRLYFDNFIASKLIQRYKIDEVLSLQNVVIPNCNVSQTVYVHNSLPFAEHRFSLFEDKLLWMYQNVISKNIFRSIEKADKVIVQTEWMKKACLEKLNVDEAKIDVRLPEIDIEVKRYYSPTKNSVITFFYPASGVAFKNHRIIVEACLKLQNEGISSYRVVFTLTGSENKHISNLYKIVQDQELPITFVGSLKKEDVFGYYSESILLFPSYIETVGLPLLEAKMHGSPILASDCAFSHEILSAYEISEFFNPFDNNQLKVLMKNIITGKESEKNN